MSFIADSTQKQPQDLWTWRDQPKISKLKQRGKKHKWKEQSKRNMGIKQLNVTVVEERENGAKAVFSEQLRIFQNSFKTLIHWLGEYNQPHTGKSKIKGHYQPNCWK